MFNIHEKEYLQGQITGGLDSQVGSVVGQSAKVTGSIPGGGEKCWAQMEFVNIYQFRFHPMLKYACVYCVRFVLINSQHCGQPWRWLVAAYRVVMFGCIISGSLCSIVSVLSCVAACCKISVADCQLLK